MIHDDRNVADTKRGYGFRGSCSCGDESRVYATVRMARAWNREHLADPAPAQTALDVSPAREKVA